MFPSINLSEPSSIYPRQVHPTSAKKLLRENSNVKQSNKSEHDLPDKPMENGSVVTAADKIFFMEWMPSQC